MWISELYSCSESLLVSFLIQFGPEIFLVSFQIVLIIDSFFEFEPDALFFCVCIVCRSDCIDHQYAS